MLTTRSVRSMFTTRPIFTTRSMFTKRPMFTTQSMFTTRPVTHTHTLAAGDALASDSGGDHVSPHPLSSCPGPEPSPHTPR